MADESDDTGGNEGTDVADDGLPKTGKFREKYENTLSENSRLKAELAVHEAGLTHLSEKQRRAVVRDLQDDKKEVTAENLKAAAKDLGYPQAPPAPKGEQQNDDQGNENGDGTNPDGSQMDAVDEALSSLDAIERARQTSVPAVDPGSFEAKLAAAKSADEVTALIRSEGHKVGIVHEMDID